MIKFRRYLLSLFQQCFNNRSDQFPPRDNPSEEEDDKTIPPQSNNLPPEYCKNPSAPSKSKKKKLTKMSTADELRKRKVSAPTWSVWRDAFQMFDKDMDGKITSAEIKMMLEKFDCFPTAGEVEDIVSDIDMNHNGCIEAIEFVTMMEHRYRDQPFNADEEKEDFKAAFDLFDKDKDGYISVPEMQTVLHTLGETSTETELSVILNKSGVTDPNKIQFDDFYAVLKRKVSREESHFKPTSSS